MRVLHICVTSNVTDGLSYQENLLTKYHRELGHDVTLITSRWALDDNGRYGIDCRDDYVNGDGVRVIRLAMAGREDCRRKLMRYRHLYGKMEQCRPEILFIHNVSYRDAATIARYLRRHPGVAAYADNHGDFSNSATNWASKYILHRIIWRHYARLLLPYVRKFYGVLPARVDFLVNMYGLPKEKCALLVMGADDGLVEKNGRDGCRAWLNKELGIRQDDFVAITGGKIDRWKKQTILLMEAVRAIPDRKVRLIVFGPAMDGLGQEVHRLADNERVFYIGWIGAEESYRYFAAADLAVFPGRHSVFWEQAAGQGIPMVCRDWEGTHHVDVGGNVRFVSGGSAGELKEAIAYIAGHPDVYRAMKQAAAKGMGVFSYRDIARRCIEDSSSAQG